MSGLPLIVLAALLPLTASPPPPTVHEGTSLSANAQEKSMIVGAERPGAQGPGSATSSGADDDPYEYDRIWASICGELDGLARSDRMCVAEVEGGPAIRPCADGSTALAPLWRRPVDPVTGLFAGPWEQVDNGGCPEDPGNRVVLSGAEFARLPLVASGVHLQPEDGRGLVNMPLIVFTDPEPQTLATTVLGVAVTVVATPVSYRWDFGDGTSLTTTDPGRPYPDHTTTGMYTAPGEFAVTLTTTWTGTYQVAGAGPWHPVAGTATTTSAPVATVAVEAHTHLVAEP